METKPCPQCGFVKPLSDYPTKRGKPQSWCKACKRADEARPEYKARRNARKRQRYAEIDEADREKRRAYQRQFPHKPGRERDPEKTRARDAVRKKVKHGRLPHPTTLPCSVCGKPAAHYHHYDGYSLESRYKVKPVCVKCHFSIHKPLATL